MGQHKHNPNCQKAENCKFTPKPRKPSKREQELRFISCMPLRLAEFYLATTKHGYIYFE